MKRNTPIGITLKIFGFWLVIYILIMIGIYCTYFIIGEPTPDNMPRGGLNVAVVYWPICIIFTVLCLGFLRSTATLKEHFRWLDDCKNDPELAKKSKGLYFPEAKKRGLVRKIPWFPKNEDEESVF